MSVDNQTQEKWELETTISASTVNLRAIGAAADKNHVFWVIEDYGGTNKDILSYDPSTKLLKIETSMTIGLYLPGIVMVDKNLYVIGGINGGKPTSNVRIYDTESKIWTEGASMPTARGYITPAVVGKKIFIIGGYTWDTKSYLNIVEVYDIDTNTWETKQVAQKTLATAGVAVYENNIYVVGGEISSCKDTWEYNTITSEWSKKAEAPIARLSTAVRVGNRIYATGSATGGPVNNKVFIYDILTDAWTEGPTLLTDKLCPFMVLLDNKLYITDLSKSVESLHVDNAHNRLCVLMNVEEKLQLSVSHNLLDNANLTWHSSLESVATVDADGKATAVGEGTTEIYAESEDGIFREYIPIKVFSGNADAFRLAVDLMVEETAQLYLTHDPKAVDWDSMDESIATVSDIGTVTAVKEGLVIIQGTQEREEYQVYVRVNKN